MQMPGIFNKAKDFVGGKFKEIATESVKQEVVKTVNDNGRLIELVLITGVILYAVSRRHVSSEAIQVAKEVAKTAPVIVNNYFTMPPKV